MWYKVTMCAFDLDSLPNSVDSLYSLPNCYSLLTSGTSPFFEIRSKLLHKKYFDIQLFYDYLLT